MHILHRRGWEIPESQATPEPIYLSRRALLGGMTALAAGAALPSIARADADPAAELYPAKRNDKFGSTARSRPRAIAANYNNFYEFGTDKEIAGRAQALKIRPWTVKIDGMVEKPMTIDIDDLLRSRCRSRSGSTAIAASRPGRWRCRGPAFRWRRSSSSPSRWLGQIRADGDLHRSRRWRRRSRLPLSPGPISRA